MEERAPAISLLVRVAHRRPESTRAWIPFVGLLLLGVQEGLAQTGIDLDETDPATTVAFVNVAVVSMKDQGVLQDQTVIVEADRILAVGPADVLSVPAGATVIDGSGRYLMPGLADMHVHVRVPFANGPLFLNSGITTVLSLATRSTGHASTLEERERSRTPAFMGPTLYTAGPLIYSGATPDEVERIVRENVDRGYDLVKVYGTLSPEAYARLNDTARRLDIKVTGHAQRNRGMRPVYEHEQDLAHVEEYLYAAFNPLTLGLKIAACGVLLALAFFSLTNVCWGACVVWRRLRKHRSAESSPGSRPLRRAVHVFTGIAWLLFIGLSLSLTEPFPGVYAGKTAATVVVGVLMLLAASVAVLLTLRTRRAWSDRAITSWKGSSVVVGVGLAWIFVACSGFLTVRSWRTTEAGLNRIAQETATAGIWVTPTLVVLDYIKRQSSDEFHTLIRRPGMRYLRPSTRNRWIYNNEFRVPPVMAPLQFAMWKNWADLMSRLVGELHEANVPLLAGSDAVGPHGVLPGSSLHEELSLLVQAGLTPYEALRTATVNPAIYLGVEQETGKVAAGFRADLVLLAGNPLDVIEHVRSRIGVMKRGRWFSASELETALEQLAEKRQ